MFLLASLLALLLMLAVLLVALGFAVRLVRDLLAVGQPWQARALSALMLLGVAAATGAIIRSVWGQ